MCNLPENQYIIGSGPPMGTLSIIIPAYNEEAAIGEIIERVLGIEPEILSAAPEIASVEVIIVDDGSRDRTSEIASRYPQVRLISHSVKRGYGAALKTGFSAARGEYIAFLDADGTYQPEALPELCRKLMLEAADMVIGSRFGGKKSGMPLERRVGNKLFALLLSWIVDRKVTDTASGLRVFRREILTRLHPLPDGLDMTPAMSTRALHENLKIFEVPIAYDERVGKSKLKLVSDGLRFFKTIVGIARLYNPLKFFGAIGISLIFLGLLLGLDPAAYYLMHRKVLETSIYRLFAVMVLLVTGLNVIIFGVVANYVLAIMHGREPSSGGILGRLLLNRLVLRRLGPVGLAFVLSAIALNHRTICEYLTTLHITVHWSYILTGATLFIVGSQLIMADFLIKVLEELKRRTEQRQ